MGERESELRAALGIETATDLASGGTVARRDAVRR